MYGNVLTGAAGFFLAAAGVVDWWLFAATIVGMTLVVGSACAINNYLDRDIDSKMKRTLKRPSVTGEVPGWSIVVYSIVLGVAGAIMLALWTNWLVVAIGIVGWVTYVWFYGAWSKRQSIYGTAVGSISGAMPIAGGYAAVSGQIDLGLVIAFAAVFFWQFPEFYSIAIYRRREYKAAGVPVMSVVKGVRSTIVQIFIGAIFYAISVLALPIAAKVGAVYVVVMAIASLYWVWLGWQGLKAARPEEWARRMFRMAMIQILVLCVMFSIGPLLP